MWQVVALTSVPTLNFLKRILRIQSFGVPLKDLKRYQQVIGLPKFSAVTSGELTSSYMSTVLLQWYGFASAEKIKRHHIKNRILSPTLIL